jgi:hypothetical protein
MNALGALDWNGVKLLKDGPFGQLGNAHVIPLDEEDALRGEYESEGVLGEGQPMEIGDDVAEECGEELNSIFEVWSL